MVRSSRLLLALLLSSFVVLTTQAAQTHLATPSTWKLNLAETDFGGSPPMKSEVFVMLIDTPQWMKFTDVVTDADGKVTKASWSGPADGTMHPFRGNSTEQLGVNAANDTEVITTSDGSTQTCLSTLSADRKKFSEKCITVMKNGKRFSQLLVYDRTR